MDINQDTVAPKRDYPISSSRVLKTKGGHTGSKGCTSPHMNMSVTLENFVWSQVYAFFRWRLYNLGSKFHVFKDVPGGMSDFLP